MLRTFIELPAVLISTGMRIEAELIESRKDREDNPVFILLSESVNFGDELIYLNP
jgi:hypothetical protein